MKCDWVFLKQDGSKLETTLEGAAPQPGEDQWHEKTGYVVRHVTDDRTITPNPAVNATEHRARLRVTQSNTVLHYECISSRGTFYDSIYDATDLRQIPTKLPKKWHTKNER